MNERTINPDFSKLIENYEKFAEVLKEEDPNVTISLEQKLKILI